MEVEAEEARSMVQGAERKSESGSDEEGIGIGGGRAVSDRADHEELRREAGVSIKIICQFY